ncbi:hypothetical protein A9Q81_12795 [Gammaproteobacteria bacterium 42_54_T18]|nr:hypothetical protein A9Q81_12795 [Gammaproteobacteria bacterium 42_54_T18]
MQIQHTSLLKKTGIIALLPLFLFLSGCTTIYDTAGLGMVVYGKDRMLPYFLSTDDPEVACTMGEAMSPVIGSFGSVTDEFGSLLGLASGMCADMKAKEAELRNLRAMRLNLPSEARDARTQQKRYLALAAKRLHAGYLATVRVHGEPGESCPVFSSEASELFWIMGLIDGMQALVADIASGTSIGVPLSIVPKIQRSMNCLDNEKWWGLPEGIEALTMILLPGDPPAGVDPEKNLQHAVDIGNQQGVRMVQMLQATLYAGNGDYERVKRIIKDHVKSKSEVAPIRSLRFLDEVATLQIRLISDIMWTKATGERTPYGKLGVFWDDKPSMDSSALDIDDLL